MENKNVIILTYDELCWFEFGIATEIFALKRNEFEHWYQTKIITVEKETRQSSMNVSFSAPYNLDAILKADLVIIPGWPSHKKPSEDLVKMLQAAMKKGVQFATICSGVFLLAQSGLLNNKKVTTHWRYANQLSDLYPDIKVHHDALYIHDGNISSSAGSSAGIDLCLSIVKKDYGSKAANIVAHRLVIAGHREGDQSQHVEQPVQQDRGGKLAPILDELRSNLNQPWDVIKIAKRAQMSERSLQRRFKQITNMSAMNWLINERLIYAKSLLENLEMSLNEVSDQAGFPSPDIFRLHFKRRYKIAPSHYRNQLL